MTPTRRPGRRRMLLWSAPALLLVLLVCAKLLSLSVINDDGREAFSAGHFGASVESFDSLKRVNVVERYLARYNAGTALLAQGDLADARRNLERALPLAPADRSCRVRYNLVRAIELQGDARLDAGARPDAVALWRQAKSVIAAGQCPPEHSNGPGDRLAEADRRLDDKLNQEQNKPDPQPQPSPSPSPPPSSDPTPPPTTKPGRPSKEQQRRLKERNRQGEEEQRGSRQDKRDLDSTDDPDGSRPNW